MADLSVATIITVYSVEEIDAQIARLKLELENLYSSASGAGKAGTRSLEVVRGDLEVFAQAKQTLSGSSPGLVRTQAI